MGRILFSIFLSTGIISASALESTDMHKASSGMKPEAVASLKLQPDPDSTKITTSYRPAHVQTVAMNSIGSPSEKADSGWQYLSTLLVTLVLIGAIAVRRHTAGKH